MNVKQFLAALAIGALAFATSVLAGQKEADVERQLKAAMNTELVDRDPRAAKELYKKVAASGIRPLSAKALIRLAACYVQLGDTEANRVYELILNDYAEQKEAVAEAQARLKLLPNGATRNILSARITRDGSKVSGPVTYITQDKTAWELRPVFSPDGKSVAFKRGVAAGEGSLDLVVRSLANGSERLYTTSFGTMRSSTLYYWLPNSKAVVLALATATTSRKQYLLDLTRAEFKEIPGLNLDPHAVSLDGRVIYSLVRKQNNQISVSSMDFASGQVRETPVRGFFNEAPELGGLSGIRPMSPDGQKLLLTNREGPAMHLTWVAVDGSGFRDLYASNLVGGRLLEWTADGRAILFGQFVPGSDGRARNEARIMRIPVDGGEPTFTGLTLKGVTANDTINVSPDGTRIVFSGNPESFSMTDPKSAH